MMRFVSVFVCFAALLLARTAAVLDAACPATEASAAVERLAGLDGTRLVVAAPGNDSHSVGGRLPVEVVFQLPAGPHPLSGVVLFLHGCGSSATRYWPRSAACAVCAALPEAARCAAFALSRRLLVVAVTSTDRRTGCWAESGETPRVLAGLAAALEAAGLPPLLPLQSEPKPRSPPLFIFGFSSGGRAALRLAKTLSTAVSGMMVQLAFLPASEILVGTPLPPIMWLSMPRDHKVSAGVAANVALQRHRGSTVSWLLMHPLRLCPTFFADRIAGVAQGASRRAVANMSRAQLLDADGFLLRTPVDFPGEWKPVLSELAAATGDSLKKDASPIFEELS